MGIVSFKWPLTLLLKGWVPMRNQFVKGCVPAQPRTQLQADEIHDSGQKFLKLWKILCGESLRLGW